MLCPGDYREGLAAVLAPELTREAIFDALKKRRTYAVTGARIELDFRINGHRIGEILPYTPQREILVSVSGWDDIASVEVLKNNAVIHRGFPIDRTATGCSVRSCSSRRDAFAEDDTKAIALKISGDPETRLQLDVQAPTQIHIDRPLKDFAENSDVIWTGTYPSKSIASPSPIATAQTSP